MGNKKIENIGLNVTAYAAVQYLGVKTAGQLAKLPWREMSKMHRFFKRKGVKENIAASLKKEGYQLRD